MPWKEQRTMSLKLQFVERAAQKGSNLSALCLEFGVSRQTGHKWLRRYRELGPLGLVEQSRRPDSSPGGTGEDVVLAILALRNQHRSGGPNKFSRVLQRSFGPDAPSRSTVARTLRRLGKVKRRRSPVRIWTVDGRPSVEVSGPDDLWTMDFKGWWRAGNGQKCEPFTVRDATAASCWRRRCCRALAASWSGGSWSSFSESTALRARSSATTARPSVAPERAAGFPSSRPGWGPSASRRFAPVRRSRRTKARTNA